MIYGWSYDITYCYMISRLLPVCAKHFVANNNRVYRHGQGVGRKGRVLYVHTTDKFWNVYSTARDAEDR